MLDTSGSLGFADDPVGGGNFGLPGLLAAAICAVGLLIGVFALATGVMWLAVVGLGVALMGPWLGMALLSYAQRGAYNVALPPQD
ncbi:hypothetical protein [Mycobacterium saskatchewanense]|nr:hypothetical protein [Mycobacterium saskatchewanense]